MSDHPPDRPDDRTPNRHRVRGGTLRTAVVWDALRDTLAAQATATGRDTLDVLDAGGGTGGFAVPLAEEGHRVTVVDPSPDSLAALERRATQAGAQVRGLQGDAAGLLDVVSPESADLVLCHSVLEFVELPGEAVAAVARVARPGGVVSVLAANRNAVVLSRAATGQFAAARHALDDHDGRWGAADPVPRRFTLDQLVGLLADADLTVREAHGVRVFADLVPGGLVESEPGAFEALRALEVAVAERPAFRDIAAQLHLLAVRG